MRHFAIAWLAAVLLGTPAWSAPPEVSRVASDLVAELLRFHRVDAKEMDTEPLRREAEKQLRSRVPVDLVREWLDGEITVVAYRFAPTYAMHDARVRYALPFDDYVPRYMSQGAGGALGEGSHHGSQHFSFDFVLPLGAEVRAARAGRVVDVSDGHTEGGLRSGLIGNGVVVLHADGTFARYWHFQPGVAVKEGESVLSGQVLGFAGSTGYSSGPHLHFGVSRRNGERKVESIPIRFGRPGSRGFVPERAQFYGFPPRPNTQIRITAAGQLVDPKVPIEVRTGATIPLQVEIQLPNGTWLDVTDAPQTTYASNILWSMRVDEGGVVRAVPSEGFGDLELDRDLGSVAVLFGRRGGLLHAGSQVSFTIRP